MLWTTRRPNNIHAVLKSGLCIGCGICAYSDAIGTMGYSERHAQSIPVLTKQNDSNRAAFALCPGKGYDLIADSDVLFNQAPYDLDLGHVYSSCAAHANDKDVLTKASSGGVMAQIAIFLLERHLVDRVLVTHFHYGPSPRTACILASTRREIINSQGSKYCPVDLSLAVREIKTGNFKVAVLGTPCQIAGIRNIEKHDPLFSAKVVIAISTFCGGIKSYHNVDLLARRHGIEPSNVTSFRFRGNGQPGSLLIQDRHGKAVEVSLSTVQRSYRALKALAMPFVRRCNRRTR